MLVYGRGPFSTLLAGDSCAAAFGCRDVGPDGPNNKHIMCDRRISTNFTTEIYRQNLFIFSFMTSCLDLTPPPGPRMQSWQMKVYSYLYTKNEIILILPVTLAGLGGVRTQLFGQLHGIFARFQFLEREFEICARV